MNAVGIDISKGKSMIAIATIIDLRVRYMAASHVRIPLIAKTAIMRVQRSDVILLGLYRPLQSQSADLSLAVVRFMQVEPSL